MITVDETVRTALGPEAAFNYLKEFEHTCEWDPGTPVTEKRSTGPVAVGSKFHAEAQFRGKRQPIDYVVTELSENSITLRGENASIVSVDTITVAGLREGASVRYRAEFTVKGWKRIAEPLLKNTFQGLAQPAVDGMKAKLDSLV
ncbi:MAG: SRPBCC family protein [Mycobacteriaceae bacterium]